jgi:hypothetical protein
MRNYRRLSGDGSVKAVVSSGFVPGFTTAARRESSPYSNSVSAQKFRTLEFCTLHSKFCIERATRRREPLPYNSPPTQEVCTSIPLVAADVRRLISPANRLLHPGLAARARQADPCGVESPATQSKVNNLAPAQSHSDSQKVDSSPSAEGALVQSFKGGRRSLRPSFHPCYAAISRISSPNKKTRLPLKCRLPHCRLDGTRPHALDDCFGPCLAISPENVDYRDLLSTRHLSFKKTRESAIVHVTLRPLPAQKVEFLAIPLLGYWLLVIGYFSVRPYPTNLGTSHFI